MKYSFILLFALMACKSSENQLTSFAKDKHTAASRTSARIKHLDLDIQVDMDNRILFGEANYVLDENRNSDTIYFDTKELVIEDVMDPNSKEKLTYHLFNSDNILGSALEIILKEGTKAISITYKTSTNAAALQWLNPEQTAGKKHPFLYTQSQAILARSWIPCQDGPAIRFTYNAKVKVNKELMALMSGENSVMKNDSGIYTFKQTRPIPSYLMALAVGDLAFKPLSENTGVYAEPIDLDKCAAEFVDLPKMMKAAENLYGKYQWNRYDVLVLPPSFPFGGMENPELTFATPTIIAGDRSLVSLLAHELAHSWSGNLVTNATWNDFWLNEGFTVYFERRIMEAIEGKEYADMLQILGYQDLQEELKAFGKGHEDTRLYLDLDVRDPDEGLTDIAYEKGALFLIHIESIVGRKKFDSFLKNYFQSNAFKTMDTKGFLNLLSKELINGDEKLAALINAEAWIYESDLPNTIPSLNSEKLEVVNKTIVDFAAGKNAKELNTKNWSSHEYLYFIRGLPKEMDTNQLRNLRLVFDFANSGNSELEAAWFEHVIRHQYKTDYKSLENFLMKVGRRKFLMPLYTALASTVEGKKYAQDIYVKARNNYHYVSIQSLDELLK
jgi:leukotriene A-4 hydrolase/aminopeptidase